MSDNDWSLTEEIGGVERLREIVAEFYGRVFEDPIIGFFFDGHDKQRLIDKQVEYVRARLGSGEVDYTGKPIRGGHETLPIMVGHFDRRHQILLDVLDEYGVDGRARREWVELEQSLRDLVLRTGEQARDDILDGDSDAS